MEGNGMRRGRVQRKEGRERKQGSGEGTMKGRKKVARREGRKGARNREGRGVGKVGCKDGRGYGGISRNGEKKLQQ